MTIHELCVALQALEPEDDVVVALYVEDTAELFAIESVRAHQGHAALEIYAAEEADDGANGNGAVRREPTGPRLMRPRPPRRPFWTSARGAPLRRRRKI
jgi:hypothetical protein